jgi:predicted transcriptional regulator
MGTKENPGRFPNLQLIFMDKDILQKAGDHYIAKFRKVSYDKRVSELAKDPENVKNTLHQADLLQQHVQSLFADQGGWFGLKDVVDNTNLNYAGAGDVLNMLYAFGVVATKEEGKRTLYRVMKTKSERIQFVKDRIAELTAEHTKKIAEFNQALIHLSKSPDEEE